MDNPVIMPRPEAKKRHLFDKYKEIVWALSHQDYTYADIGEIMGRSRAVIKRIADTKPKDWTPKWVKVV